MVEFFIFGFLGGILRGFVGLIKYNNAYKDVEIRPWYFAGTVVISGFIGAVAAWVTHDLGIDFLGVQSFSPALGVVMGYAGGDLLENLFKIFTGKTTLFK